MAKVKTDFERHLENVLAAEQVAHERTLEAHEATLLVVQRLRLGLKQIVEGDYPSDAGNAETWAQELLDRPEAVEWEDEHDGYIACPKCGTFFPDDEGELEHHMACCGGGV